MKLLTHAYLANIILDELERTGGLSLPDVKGNYSSGSLREPFPSAEGGALCFPLKEGTYAPPDTVKETILNNREYFRGGVIGGSFLPDIAFSMSVLRPTDSGIWLEYLSDRFKTLKKGTERDQVYAFLLGMTVNYTADMFLRSYVTECAGGVFDSYSKDMGKRHLLIDEYIERAISFKIPDDKLKISVPSKFLAVCFADGLAVENQIKKIKDEKRSKKVLSAYNGKPLTQLRSRSYRSSGVLDEKRRESSEVLVYPEDMKKKITETEQWVAAWVKLAQDILDGGIPAECIPSDNTGFSDAEIKKMIESVFVPKRSQMKIEEDLEKAFWEKKEEEKEKKDDDSDKEEDEKKTEVSEERYDVCARIRADLKDFGGSYNYPLGEAGEFKAFSLALAASKFCLIGYKELNRYIGKVEFKEDKSAHSLSKIKLTVTSDKKLIDAFPDGRTLCGFEISTKSNGNAYNSLLPMDLAKNGEVTIDLPSPIPYEEITHFTLFSTSVFKWDVSGFKVNDETSGKVLVNAKPENAKKEEVKKDDAGKKDEKKDDGKTTAAAPAADDKKMFSLVIGKDFSVDIDAKVRDEVVKSLKDAPVIDTPNKLMSWLYSIDGNDPSGKPGKKPWENEEYAIYRALVNKFRPTLLSDVLSEKFDDTESVPEKKADAPEKKAGASKGVDPFDLSMTPEGDMMSVTFEGIEDPYVRKRDRVLPKVKKVYDDLIKDMDGMMRLTERVMDLVTDAGNDLLSMEDPPAKNAKKPDDESGKDAGMDENMEKGGPEKEEMDPEAKKDPNDETMENDGSKKPDKKDGMDPNKKKDPNDETMENDGSKKPDKKKDMDRSKKEDPNDETMEKGGSVEKEEDKKGGVKKDSKKDTGLCKDKKKEKDEEEKDKGENEKKEKEKKKEKNKDEEPGLNKDKKKEKDKKEKDKKKGEKEDDGMTEDEEEDDFGSEDDEEEDDDFGSEDDEEEDDDFGMTKDKEKDDDDDFGF